ncbi:HDIG domain-containing metalloprotein [Methanolobus vulcani]|uniref:HDIG domain-containing protein n=1 Tax=Methanolobus vulcani TaxID=38026 RepID=A0A7Z8KL92_9EURY|nr:HDIG domain-containing metalloprotein [Methanolobus vulcani]TQD23451.1 HDIG domain-containing protein [Methanolobus vulcani]
MISREAALNILTESGCNKKVIAHCIAVSDLAKEIAAGIKSQGKDVDIDLVEIGGLLHDLGRAQSHGIDHAILGVELAKSYGLEPGIQELIKRHIGAGITRDEARELHLPDNDYIPVTLEQKIVAHADNLLVGTERISIEKRIHKMEKKGIGKGSIDRVKALAEEIGFIPGKG